jgi:predicted DNA-binding transcriptional regulator YafY
MYQPASRVLSMLEMLQSRPGITGGEIAERLEVDRRTVRRYITTLQDLGVPVNGVRGRHGGYVLRPGYRLPPLMLTDDEALAVSLGLLISSQLGLSIAQGSTESASAKLSRVLPVPLREQARAIRDVVSLTIAPADAVVDGELIGCLSGAAGKGRRVRLDYLTYQRISSQRDVDPYGLVYLTDRWYMVGYCHLREDTRMFRLDRIERYRLLETTFKPPQAFDCLKFATDALATMPGNWSVSVRLELPLSAACERIPPTHGVLTADGDATLLQLTADNLDRTARFLVGLDCRFYVIEPEELRSRLRYLARQIEQMAADCDESACVESELICGRL